MSYQVLFIKTNYLVWHHWLGCVQMWPTESRTAALIYPVWFTVGSPLNTVTLSQYIRLCCHLLDKNTTKKYHKTHYGWIYTRAAAQPFSQCTKQNIHFEQNKYVPKRSLDPLFLLLSKSTLPFPLCRCLIHQHRSYYCTVWTLRSHLYPLLMSMCMRESTSISFFFCCFGMLMDIDVWTRSHVDTGMQQKSGQRRTQRQLSRSVPCFQWVCVKTACVGLLWVLD